MRRDACGRGRALTWSALTSLYTPIQLVPKIEKCTAMCKKGDGCQENKTGLRSADRCRSGLVIGTSSWPETRSRTSTRRRSLSHGIITLRQNPSHPHSSVIQSDVRVSPCDSLHEFPLPPRDPPPPPPPPLSNRGGVHQNPHVKINSHPRRSRQETHKAPTVATLRPITSHELTINTDCVSGGRFATVDPSRNNHQLSLPS
jgi:hypothetical protein